MSRGLAPCIVAALLVVVATPATASEIGTANVRSESVRFLVGEVHPGTHYDSYVLTLAEPAAIVHARDLIERGPAEAGRAIVVAKVAQGRDGINRNYIAPGAPLWSWHVAEFIAFADITAEIYDGWPGSLGDYESDPEYLCCGMIGFWSYTVVAELPSGDYDGDLDVDDDDYLLWAASYGATSKTLGADGNGNGGVDAADYTVWRDRLGTSATLPPYLFPPMTDTSSTVPEPVAIAHSLLALWALSVRRWLRC